MKTPVALLCLSLTASCVTPVDPSELPLSDNVTDWRDEIIYQIVTDRFANGDSSNDYGVDIADPSAYHGGDWRGIIDKLDYIEALGVTALWISPVVKNVEQDAGFASYHGYWTQDFTRPNPHFGDISALRELVDACHARGIKVILDIVVNHVGQAFYYDINKNGQPDEFGIGQGGEIVPIDQVVPSSDLVRISEWDPDFDTHGVQAWTSLGGSGLAPVIFARNPNLRRVPPQPEIFARAETYNRRGRVTVWTNPAVCGCPEWGCAWDDPCRREQELLGDFPGGLKDIDTTREDVRDALYEVYARWIDLGDFDGFRIDTLKHVEEGFFEDFCPRIRAHANERGKHNFLMFGEAFDGDDHLLGAYTRGEGVDSVFYFSQYFTVFRDALLQGTKRTCEIERLYCQRTGCAADPCGEGQQFSSLFGDTGKSMGLVSADGEPLAPTQTVVGFISNHDVGRLMYFMPSTWSYAERRRVLHLALTFLLTTDGIPSLYYGVEQEFAGGNDPANRETLWDDAAYHGWLDQGRFIDNPRYYDSDGNGTRDKRWLPYDTQNPTFRYLASLIRLRKEHVALRRGSLEFRWSARSLEGEDAGVLAIERDHPQERVLMVAGFSASQQAHTRVGGSTMVVGFQPGAELTDLLSSDQTYTVLATGCPRAANEGCLDVDVPPHGARILVQK